MRPEAMNTECDSCDRSGDPAPPNGPAHAAEYKHIRCPGCDREGVVRANGWGMSLPHGWWTSKYNEFFCSSECIAKTFLKDKR